MSNSISKNKGLDVLYFSCPQCIKLITVIFVGLFVVACSNKELCTRIAYGWSDETKNEYLNAAKDGNIELVKSYVPKVRSDIGVVDEQGRTALILASANGYVDIVKLFTVNKHKCFSTDIDHKDHNGKTALMIAREAGYTDVVDLLIRAGAKDDSI